MNTKELADAVTALVTYHGLEAVLRAAGTACDRLGAAAGQPDAKALDWARCAAALRHTLAAVCGMLDEDLLVVETGDDARPGPEHAITFVVRRHAYGLEVAVKNAAGFMPHTVILDYHDNKLQVLFEHPDCEEPWARQVLCLDVDKGVRDYREGDDGDGEN